jgi:hypothetical protein
VKVYGPAGKPLEQAIDDVQQVSQEIAAKLKGIRGAVDVVPDQAVGKRYVEIRVDQEKARYYGVNMGELSEAIETAIGGSQVTTTVEGRQRFPVRVRYARDYWQDVDAIGNVLVTARSTAAKLEPGKGANGGGTTAAAAPAQASASPGGMGGGGMGGASGAPSASPTAAGRASAQSGQISAEGASSVMQIPLRMVADVRVTEGPSMIKSENGRLRNYVTLNVRDRDVVGFVDEARHDFLADTGLAENENGHIRGCYMSADVDDPKHLRIGRQDVALFYVRQLLFQSFQLLLQLLFLYNVRDRQFERFFLERLRQIVGGANFHCLHDSLDLPNT